MMYSANPIRQYPTIWKSASNGLMAHIYEHIVVTHLTSVMSSKSQLRLADYDIWAKTYGTSVFIETRFQTSEAYSDFLQAVDSLSKLSLTYDMLKKAALECSCEYLRPLTRLAEAALNDFQALHKTSWHTIQEFTVERATRETSVNTLFELPHIRYGRQTPRSYETLAIEYTVPTKTYVNDPTMKVLSILVVQTIALNQIDSFYESLLCYDNGDEWAEASEQVAYRTYLTFPKKELPIDEELESLYNQNLLMLKNVNIAEKLANTIQSNYHDESLQYFDIGKLNDISGGIIVGPAGWSDVATVSNIEKIIDNLSIEHVLIGNDEK